MAVVEIWTYKAGAIEDLDLTGFTSRPPTGGRQGDRVRRARGELAGRRHRPVDLGKKVLLPRHDRAGRPEERKIHVTARATRSRRPEHDPSGYRDQEYRLALADYYARFY